MTNVDTRRLFIIGASARAAAQSARRAGTADIVAADYFGDQDLRSSARWIPLDLDDARFLEGITEHLADCTAWLYTGGLENRPRIIERLARWAPLAGNRGEVLARARDPVGLWQHLSAQGLAHLWAETASRPPNADRQAWLCKPRRSAGGIGIVSCDRLETAKPNTSTAAPGTDSDGLGADHVYQRSITGRPGSALFVARPGQLQLLSVTEQLIGTDWGAPGPFRYAGNIGPMAPCDALRDQWGQLGRAAASLGLIGLFGIDAIVTSHGVVGVELNPRVTAGAEVWERATGHSAVGAHLIACGFPAMAPVVYGCQRQARNKRALPNPSGNVCGKRILFSDRRLVVTPQFLAHVQSFCQQKASCQIADVPALGQTILPHAPVLTVLATGQTPQQVAARLKACGEAVR